VLDAHPHARAVLGSALRGEPSHAYLFHGPAGSGKAAAARAFAEALLAGEDEGARARVRAGTHPDLTWVAPSGAHEMLRRDVDDAVVSAATRTPFEAQRRVFVLERADTLNDEAANALLKTLEEPPAYVVLMLLTDRLTQVMPTIASRCQPVRFDPPSAQELAQRLQSRGVPPETAAACARLSLGDGERATALALSTGPQVRAGAETFARAALSGRMGAARPWKPLLDAARAAGGAARETSEAALAEELQFLPRKEQGRAKREAEERARRVERRAATGALDHALQLVGLWYRDVACAAIGVPDLVLHSDRADAVVADAAGRDPEPLRRAQELVEETRARLALNVSDELACEALGYRLERLLSPIGPSLASSP
jgi:DNA polymerase-3 subunit delta'